MTTTMTGAPAAGSKYRKRSTGRIWHVERISDSGVFAMTEEFYGPLCDVRDYVTPAALAEDYEAVS
jgi:hypothetical protein